MLNYWWVTRPKRKLNSVPEVLSAFAESSLDLEWEGQRETHLNIEDALERAGLKRIGERRDQTGGGGRTYLAWLVSLGLIFKQEATGKLKLTLAGEAIMNGDSPVSVLKNQILKYQFPSSFSLSRGVGVSERFKIRPFRFLLRLLRDNMIGYLTEEEIAKIVVVDAENESDRCYKYVIEKIIQFRNKGDWCLDKDFFIKYKPSRGDVNPEHPFSHLIDLANTLVNWLEYTQLIRREDSKVYLIDDKLNEVDEILGRSIPFVDRPMQHEYFQRKYGVDPKHRKDSRNLTVNNVVTSRMIAEQKIKKVFIGESLKRPITKITNALIDSIVEMTGFNRVIVEETLTKYYPNGAVGAFMTEYFEMAFKGRDEATAFEKATVEIFRDVFNFRAEHVGQIGLTPDVLLLSDEEGYQAIIDNKAYSKYSITNDHFNRMVHNYIKDIGNYSEWNRQPAFFSYIAGGFVKNINDQITDIYNETGVRGTAMPVTNMIRLIELYQKQGYTHKNIRNIFSLNRQVTLLDVEQEICTR